MRKWTRYGRNQEFKAYFSILVHRTYYCVAIMLTDFYNKELLIFFFRKGRVYNHYFVRNA